MQIATNAINSYINTEKANAYVKGNRSYKIDDYKYERPLTEIEEKLGVDFSKNPMTELEIQAALAQNQSWRESTINALGQITGKTLIETAGIIELPQQLAESVSDVISST